jgi:hypothetical protein
MKFLHRLAVYALVTAIIEVPSILILYGCGYPKSPSSDWIWIFLIVENLYMWLLWSQAIGGPIPGQGPRDMSFDLVWGIVSMFLIIAAIGETINWLIEEIRKRERRNLSVNLILQKSQGVPRKSFIEVRTSLCIGILHKS